MHREDLSWIEPGDGTVGVSKIDDKEHDEDSDAVGGVDLRCVAT